MQNLVANYWQRISHIKLLFMSIVIGLSWCSSSAAPGGRSRRLVGPGQHESARRGNVTRSCIARKGPGTPLGMKRVGSFVPRAVFMVNMMEHSVS